MAKSRVRQDLTLESKRGTKVPGPATCTNCMRTVRYVYRYRKSTLGVVFLCEDCKPYVFDKSFGRIDVLDVPHQGGGFESNPRRH